MRPHPDENVDMVGHAVYLQHLMLIILKNACDILMQSFFPLIFNKSGPVLYCKNKLNMNLGITIRHKSKIQLKAIRKAPIVPNGTKYKMNNFFYQPNVPTEQLCNSVNDDAN